MEKREKKKTTVIHRIRKRVHTTVSPETHEYLKKTGANVSRLLDNAVSELRKETPHNLALISQNIGDEWIRRAVPTEGAAPRSKPPATRGRPGTYEILTKE